MREAIVWAVGMGQTIVLSAGNYHIDLDSDPSKPPGDASGGAIIVGGTQGDGKNWLGSNYGSVIDLAASASGIRAATYNPATGQRSMASGRAGTSFAAPMVAAVAAMALEARLSQFNVPVSLRPSYLKQLLWGSASIAPSSSGEQLGKYLEEASRNSGLNAKVRDLNAGNAITLAKLPLGQPYVRIHNADDVTWWMKNWDWQIYSSEWQGYDSIWDMRYDGLTGSDTLVFGTYNFDQARSHGYQIWRWGYLDEEHLGGAAMRRAPWGWLYQTVGEDGGATDIGWHHWVSWSAL